MTDLDFLARKYGTDKLSHGYLPYYETHLPGVVGSLLEVGVLNGSSLKMWRDRYPAARIVGLDINPDCAKPDGCEVIVGSQTDEDLLNSLGYFDVVVDDGSHITALTLETFRIMWPRTRSLYVIEDLHCTYEDARREWPGMGYVDVDFHNDRSVFDRFLAGLLHQVDEGGIGAVHYYHHMVMIQR